VLKWGELDVDDTGRIILTPLSLGKETRRWLERWTVMKNKDYSSVDSAKRALRKAGLQAMPVEFEVIKSGLGRERILPVVQCELDKDLAEVRQRGFKAAPLPRRLAP
jgi:hypothetical protein